MPALLLDQVTKNFGDKCAVDALSFTVRDGVSPVGLRGLRGV